MLIEFHNEIYWSFSFVTLMMQSTKTWRALICKMTTKPQIKNQQIKREETCFASFVKVFKFQDNKINIVQKNCS